VNRWAIVCPGPSLKDTYRGGRFDGVVAVNRACVFAECSHLSMLDIKTWKWIQEDGGPKSKDITLLSSKGCYEHVRDKCRFKGKWFDKTVALHSVPGEFQKRFSFSIGAAFAFARMQSPNRIDVYGMDMIGEQDWDGGYRGSCGRELKRWEKERSKIAWVFRILENEGIKIVRHTADG